MKVSRKQNKTKKDYVAKNVKETLKTKITKW